LSPQWMGKGVFRW